MLQVSNFIALHMQQIFNTSIDSLVPKSLHCPATNLYTSVVDLIDFLRLVESPLHSAYNSKTDIGTITNMEDVIPYIYG